MGHLPDQDLQGQAQLIGTPPQDFDRIPFALPGDHDLGSVGCHYCKQRAVRFQLVISDSLHPGGALSGQSAAVLIGVRRDPEYLTSFAPGLDADIARYFDIT